MKMIAYAIIATLLLCFNALFQYGTIDYYDVTVTEKERIVTGSGENLSSKYLVFTEDRVFQNTDSVFHLKFNSSDLQGKLKLGGSYRVKAYGWRVPFLSAYENIVSAEELVND